MKSLEQYITNPAQNAQEPQQAPQTQEPLTVAQVAAKLDAERLSSLMAQMQEAIDEKTAPAVMLEAITGALFGTSSPQAAAVAGIIDADRHPGGHEWAIAGIRQRRKLLRQQAKQLEEQQRAIADELARLDESERALTREKAEAAALDTALIETLTFCKSLDPQQPDLLQQLETLYNRHHGNPAAMGLLCGCITDLTRQQYSAGRLDLVQQQDFTRLKEHIAAAVNG